MHGARALSARRAARLTGPNLRSAKSAMVGWRICACVIDRSFVVIRLKHLAV